MMPQPPVKAPSNQTTAAPAPDWRRPESEKPRQEARLWGGGRTGGIGGGAPLTPAQMMRLQQTVGNRAVVQMLRDQAEAPAEENADPQLDLGSDIYQNIWRDYLLPEVKRYAKSKAIETFIKAADQLVVYLSNLDNPVIKIAKALISALKTFQYVTQIWKNLHPNVKSILKYVLGVAVNKCQGYLEKYWDSKLLDRYESIAADDGAFPETVQTCLGYLETAASYADVLSLRTVLNRFMGEARNEQQPEAADLQPVENGGGDKPHVSTLDLKLVKLDMQDLTIVKKRENEKGGLDSKSQVTFRLFGTEYKVDEIHAKLDWDLALSVDAGIENRQIIDRAEFLLFTVENLLLKKLNVGNKGLNAIELEIGTFKVGELLELKQVAGKYKKGGGYEFDARAFDLHLPAPLDSSIRTEAKLKLDEHAAFHSIELSSFKAGETVTIKRAELNQQHLHIQELEYHFSKRKELKPVLYDLVITKDKRIQSVAGGLEIANLELMDGLTLDGSAKVGYDGQQFSLGVEKTKIRLDHQLVQGYGDIDHLTYRQDGTYDGNIKQVTFSVGMFTLAAQNVTIDKDRGLEAEEAEVMFGQRKPPTKEEESEMPAGSEGSSLSDLFSSVASVRVKAKGIKIKGGKLHVDKYEKQIGDGKPHKISLLGGAVQGMYDPKAKKANIAGQFQMPPAGTLFPLRFQASLPVVAPLFLFVGVGIDGGIKGTAAGEISKDQKQRDQDIYEITAKARLEGFLKFSIEAGVQLGHEFLIALRAMLKASAEWRASAEAQLTGQLRWNSEQEKMEQDNTVKPIELSYDLQTELKAKLEALLDVIALLKFQKVLYSKTLGEWTLGTFRMSGKVGEENGKRIDQVDTPKPKSAADNTLGGAVPEQIALPEDRLIAPLLDGSLDDAAEEPQKRLSDEHTIYRAAHGLLSKESDLSAEKTEELYQKLKAAATDVKGTKVKAQFDLALQHIKARRGLEQTTYLMTHDEWKTYSTTSGFIGDTDRKAIRVVDGLLEAYHEQADLTKKMQILDALRREIFRYLDLKGKSRKAMASKLLLSIKQEEALLKGQTQQPQSS